MPTRGENKMNQQEYIKELRDALQALVDVQNLPPQLAWKIDRKTVMAEAERLLAIEPPAEKPKRYGCHCDLEPGKKPDDCLIVDGVLTGHCIYGKKLLAQGKTREDCLYWLVLILALIYFLKPICIKFWEK